MTKRMAIDLLVSEGNKSQSIRIVFTQEEFKALMRKELITSIQEYKDKTDEYNKAGIADARVCIELLDLPGSELLIMHGGPHTERQTIAEVQQTDNKPTTDDLTKDPDSWGK